MIYLDLFLGFLKVGCFAFGGAYGAIPLIRDVVMSYGWLSDEMLTYMIAVSESTPWPDHGQSCHLYRQQTSRIPWRSSRDAGGCTAFISDHLVGNRIAKNCIEKRICSSCAARTETLRNRHCAGYWYLHDFRKLLWNNYCTQSKYTGNHHYCTFSCFDVWLQAFCKEKTIPDPANRYFCGSRYVGVWNIKNAPVAERVFYIREFDHNRRKSSSASLKPF